MNEKIKNIRRIFGIRLNVGKSPKVETPKTIYTRKIKHKSDYKTNTMI